MKTSELLFGLVAVIVIVLAGVFLIGTSMADETTTIETTTQEAPAMETYTFTTEVAEADTEETTEIDKEQEIEYLYVKVQTIQSTLSDLESRYRNGEDVSDDLGGVKADINDMEEHLYDVFDMLNQTEIDQFQEELDNARERVAVLEHEY